MSSRKRTRPSLKEALTKDEKIKLASLVKHHPCLWKLSDVNYRKHDVATAAWISIAEEVGKSVWTCKEAWKGLKDGLRYQQHKKRPKKSGDSASDHSGGEEPINEAADTARLRLWDFWESMRFMIEDRPQRKTSCSLELNTGTTIDVEDAGPSDVDPDALLDISDATDDIVIAYKRHDQEKFEAVTTVPIKAAPKSSYEKSGSSKAHYDYFQQPKKVKKSATESTTSADDRIAESIQALVDLRKKESETTTNEEKKTDLKYQSMYANLDRMLSSLPQDVVEELNFKFICLIRDEIKIHNE